MASDSMSKLSLSIFSVGTCALITLAFIPFSGFPNFYNSISGVMITRGVGPIHSNIALLVARDLLVIWCVAIYLLAFVGKRWPAPRFPGFLLLMSVLTLSIGISAYKFSIPVSFAALRTYEYLPMLFVFYACAQKYQLFRERFDQIVLGIILIEFFVCLIQANLMPNYEGATFLGARVIGTFNNPNTIGAVAAFSSYLLLFVSKRSMRIKALFLTLNIAILLMSGSRTAILITAVMVALFVFWKTSPRYKLFTLAFGTMSFFVLSMLIGNLAGRGNIPPLHQDPRVRITFEALDNLLVPEFLFGIAGGVRSNTLILLSAKIPEYFYVPPSLTELAESSLVSMVSQIGLVGMVIFYFTLFLVSLKTSIPGLALFVVVIMLSFSNVWLEMYPLNFLIFSTYGVLLGTPCTKFNKLRSRAPHDRYQLQNIQHSQAV